MTSVRSPPAGTDTSSAAPSKAVSGTATISASEAAAAAAAAPHPETRTLQVSTSVTMASGDARDTTNTFVGAGWSGRSMNGSRAMIFGALANSRAFHHAEPRFVAKAGTARDRPWIPTPLPRPGRADMRHERHREAEMKPRTVAHHGVAGGEIRMNGEWRLHMGEGGDDDPPDALGGIQRQDTFVPLHQPPHHVGLARGPERRPALLGLLGRDQPVDDLPRSISSWCMASSIRSMSLRRSAREGAFGLVLAWVIRRSIGERSDTVFVRLWIGGPER